MVCSLFNMLCYFTGGSGAEPPNGINTETGSCGMRTGSFRQKGICPKRALHDGCGVKTGCFRKRCGKAPRDRNGVKRDLFAKAPVAGLPDTSMNMHEHIRTHVETYENT